MDAISLWFGRAGDTQPIRIGKGMLRCGIGADSENYAGGDRLAFPIHWWDWSFLGA